MSRILSYLFTLFIALTTTLISADTKPLFLSPVFPGSPGTPRVVRNDADSLWVVAWRQGSPGRIIARTVRSNGQLGPVKPLAAGVTSASHSFDIAHDSLANRYLLAFETSRGLEVQPLTSVLAKQGTSLLVEAGVQGSSARIVFDPTRNQFLLFWLALQSGTNGKIVKVAVLSSAGAPVAPGKNVAQAAAGKNYGAMNVVRNKMTGNLLILLSEITQGALGSVIEYNVKPDGTLLVQKPLQFQGATASLITTPQAALDNTGAGFVFWNDRNLVKFRKISAKGALASPVKSISNTANVDSLQIGAAFDSSQNRYLAVWSEGKQLKSAQVNTVTGAVAGPPAALTTSSLTYARNVELSYGARENSFLVVWEDAAPSVAGGPDTKFRIRAAVISQSGPEVLVIVTDHAFMPNVITVRAGTTVRWVNQDTVAHTVTSGKPGANEGILFDKGMGRGGSVTIVFTTPGTYDYFCRVHPQGMTGLVIVTP